MTRIKAVVFDLDGTLLDTIADLTGAINRSLAACGLPTHTVDECRGFVGGGIREAVRRAGRRDGQPHPAAPLHRRD